MIHIGSGPAEFDCGAIADIDTTRYADNACTPDKSLMIQKCICSQTGCNTPATDNGIFFILPRHFYYILDKYSKFS